jgi:hypothetical protein
MTPPIDPIPINNPVFCDCIRDGKRCGGRPGYVYRSICKTQLICDACAKEYRAVRNVVPIIELSLFELVPARSVLLTELGVAFADRDKTRGQLQKLEATWILRFLRWLGWRP